MVYLNDDLSKGQNVVKTLKSKTLNKQKNKLRGLIAKSRSNAFKKGFNLDPSYIYCRGIKEIYLDSRAKLSVHEFEPFLKWVDEQNRTVASDISICQPEYANLAGVISSGISKCELGTELLWVTHLLINQSKKIHAFISFNKELQELILSEKTSKAINLIKEIDKKYGVSFYTHETRVALESLDGGLEKQKAYVAEVRSKVKGGLLGFVSYYVSIRNENKTTISKFKEDLNLRLEKNKYYDETVKRYLRYRLVGEIGENEEHLSDIIFIEQSHHIFDLYNTYLNVIQKIVQACSFHHLNKTLKVCLHHLKNINDSRIERIRSKFENTPPNLPLRNTNMSDALLSGNFINSIRAWNSMSINEKSDPWQFIYFGFILSEFEKTKRKHNEQSPLYIPQLFSKLIRPNENTPEFHLEKIKKIVLNFPCINFIKGVYDFSYQIVNKTPSDAYNFSSIEFSSSFHGAEDYNWKKTSQHSSNITSIVWSLSENSNHLNYHNIPLNIFNTVKAISMVYNKNYFETIDFISSIGKSSYGNLWSINLDLLLSSYFNISDHNSLIRTIAIEGVQKKKTFPIHSISKFLNSNDWMVYKNLDDPILTCVAIHLLWKNNDNAETASMLRFSIRQCLRNKAVKLPSDLMSLKRTTPLRAWKYFFREVCKNQFIDQLFQGSNDLLLERREICAFMLNIDYEFIDSYKNEIADIASLLAIDHGKKIIDRTRIHVDTDALKRWATKELIEDYRRYHDLLDVNVKASFVSEFNEILVDILKKGGGAEKWKSLNKDNEADMVFISLIARLSNEFLNSPEYGLDFYLSKRVRHQSFIGLIRGPLEFSKLITTKESSGEYNTNQYILSKFSNLSERSIMLVDAELKSFSKKFDDLLENTKNLLIQINDSDNPKGLIKLEIQEQAIFLLQMMAHKADDLASLVDFAVSVFWASLSTSLNNVRQHISHDLKQSIVKLFDDLTINLKKSILFSDAALLTQIHAIKECSTEVQRELDLAAKWFIRSNTDDIAQSVFNADQLLDIAIDSTLKCHQSFHPKIIKNVINKKDNLLDTTALIFAHDVMFVALGNIFRHSGIKEPNVSITTEITDEIFSILVKSDLSQKNIKQTLEKLREIRGLIQEKKFERRTRKEGGSGLLKIAAVALQDPLGSINFDVIDNSFILNVKYRLFITSVPLEGVHE